MTAASLSYPYPDRPEPGRVVVVAPGVQWIRMPLPFKLDHINLWLLNGDDGWTAVDTGYGNAPTRESWERIFRETMDGAPLARVLATHFHPDHLGNGAWLARRFGLTIWMTQAEYLTAHAVWHAVGGYGQAPTAEFFHRHGLPARDVQRQTARGQPYRDGVPELPDALHRVLPGAALALGGRSWRVIAGHGHSPEHCALFCDELRVLISGDMLLPKITTNVGVWSAEPESDPVGLYLDSLGRFETLPEDTLVLPSHGTPFRGLHRRVAELRAHHRARLDELAAALDAPRNAFDVVPVLFRRELDAQQIIFAMGEAIAHLNHLWHRGRVRRLEQAGGPYRFVRIH